MSTHLPIEGFICAIVLAVLVIAFIAYCMFCREKYKDELHYDIPDLQRQRNLEIGQEQTAKVKKKHLAAGIFILPSRHKHKDEDYVKTRPDYPETSPPLQPDIGKLVEVFSDTDSADMHYKDGIVDVDYKNEVLEIESNAQYHSDV